MNLCEVTFKDCKICKNTKILEILNKFIFCTLSKA